ncbi:MAG TPA: ABC transporter permease [Methylomirabilota bacterium]|nr:ABC transporter permease [Methylomirabilota bacterium]
MKLHGTAQLAFTALATNKVRTGLTMLGVIIGVAAVVTMMAVGAGAQGRVEAQIQSLGSNLIVVLSGTITTSGVRLGTGSQLTVTEDDARAMEREIDGIQVAAPTVRGGVQVVAGNTNWSTALFGVTPGFLEARDWQTVSGRSLIQDDIDGAAKVALVGQTVAQMLFGAVDPIGQVIRIKKVPVTVVGVLARKGQSTQGQDQDDAILVPLSTAKKKLLGTSQANARAVNAILVKVREAKAMKDVEQDIRTLLRQRHRLQPGQDDDFTLRNLSELFESQEAASRALSLLLAAIASVSLLVGGIGIMNIMLVSVTERTREIGLRRAVGARRRDILMQFLIEAVAVSLTGGVIGIGLGMVGAWAIGHFAGWLAPVQARAVIPAFIFAAAVGVFFGFFPARKASRLNPIDALRYE